MRAVIYNNENSKFHNTSDSLALRSAMFIASEICYSGHGYALMTFKDFYTAHSLIEKVNMLMSFNEESKERFNPYLMRCLTQIKDYNKRKGKSKEDIVAYKLTERTINDLFEKQKKVLEEIINLGGVNKLVNLLDREYFTMPAQATGQSELEDINDQCNPISRMLALEISYHPEDTFIDKNNPPIFFLPPEFMNDPEWREKIKKEKKIDFTPRYQYVIPLFKFPNSSMLSFFDLETIRKELEAPVNKFQPVINDWINHVYGSGKNGKTMLTDRIIPLCEAVQLLIDKNELLHQYNKHNKEKYFIEIFAGEALLEDIWYFYECFGGIKEDTRKKLEELKSMNPKYQNTYPFIALKATGTENLSYSVSEQIEIKSSKKNLDID